MKRFQVWSYQWADGHGPIADKLLFDGQEFATKAAALRAWSDTYPGRNDRAVVLPSIGPLPSIDRAVASASAGADRSWLPQTPIACAVAGFGWCVESIACGGPVASNVAHVYPVSVLPARYFEGGAAL
jgi:hypothetical protein